MTHLACLPRCRCCCSLLVLIEDASIGSLPPGAEQLPAATPKRRVCNVRQGSCIKMRPLPAKAGGLPTTEVFLMVRCYAMAARLLFASVHALVCGVPCLCVLVGLPACREAQWNAGVCSSQALGTMSGGLGWLAS